MVPPRGVGDHGQPLGRVAVLIDAPCVEWRIDLKGIGDVATNQDDNAVAQEWENGPRRDLGLAHRELVIPLVPAGKLMEQVDPLEGGEVGMRAQPHELGQPTPCRCLRQGIQWQRWIGVGAWCLPYEKGLAHQLVQDHSSSGGIWTIGPPCCWT